MPTSLEIKQEEVTSLVLSRYHCRSRCLPFSSVAMPQPEEEDMHDCEEEKGEPAGLPMVIAPTPPLPRLPPPLSAVTTVFPIPHVPPQVVNSLCTQPHQWCPPLGRCGVCGIDNNEPRIVVRVSMSRNETPICGEDELLFTCLAEEWKAVSVLKKWESPPEDYDDDQVFQRNDFPLEGIDFTSRWDVDYVNIVHDPAVVSFLVELFRIPRFSPRWIGWNLRTPCDIRRHFCDATRPCALDVPTPPQAAPPSPTPQVLTPSVTRADLLYRNSSQQDIATHCVSYDTFLACKDRFFTKGVKSEYDYIFTAFGVYCKKEGKVTKKEQEEAWVEYCHKRWYVGTGMGRERSV